MKKPKAKKLQEGDRVRLTEPFRFGAVQDRNEVEFDQKIRAAGGCGTVMANDVDVDNTVLVQWDSGQREHELWTNCACLEEENPPVTKKEERDAIQSILRSHTQ